MTKYKTINPLYLSSNTHTHTYVDLKYKLDF